MLVIAAVVYACVFVYRSISDMMYPLKYEYSISSSAQENGLDKFLVAAVIRTESNFVHDAHSGKARGLMQLTDETAQWVAEKMGIEFKTDDVDIPEVNIKMGCWYLKYLIDKYESVDTALAAYNGGMGNVSKWLADERYSDDGRTLKYIPFEETRNYVKKVNEYKEIYEKKYSGGA
jgi:soluble lytic murein transglycosylase